MFNIIKLFMKLFLYKFLLFNLNVFKNFLLEKHFYLFNKFIILYAPSSVSTEFRKVFFSKEKDKNDELYGDSNFFFNAKVFFNYLKDYNHLKFNLLNFNYILKFRQQNRAFFLFNFKKQQFISQHYKTTIKISKLCFVSVKQVIFEKFKLLYAQKSIFSYIYIFLIFLILILKSFFGRLKKQKKLKDSYYNFLSRNKQNNINLKYYYEFRFSVFNDYLSIKKQLYQNVFQQFKFNWFFKKIDFFFNKIILKFYLLKKINILFFFIFFQVVKYIHKYFFYYEKKYLCIYFVLFLKKLKQNIVLRLKFIRSFFLNKNYKSFLLDKYIYVINLRFIIMFKLLYFIKYHKFLKFVQIYLKQRNLSYLNLISIMFTIKKDLKKRYLLLMSQVKSRQKNDLNDLDFFENINNFFEEKNKDFFLFSFLSKFSKKRKKSLFFNKYFNYSNKILKRKFFKQVNFFKNKKYSNVKKNKFIDYYYITFFSKYLYNLYLWSFLLKFEKNRNLLYFILRKLFFYKYSKVLNLKKIFLFINFNNFLKIKYYRLSEKIKFFLKKRNLLLSLKKKKKKKFKKKQYLKFFKINKKVLLKINLNRKKKKIISFQIYKNNFFLINKKKIQFFNFKKPLKLKKKKKIKLFFSLNFFSHKKFNFNNNNNLLFLKNYLLIKKKKKKKIKKLMILKTKYLKFHNYKILRKRKKLNFLNFFEQSENYLLSQKLFSLYISRYKNNSWFNDLHNYSFFHKYFILKRDRFWYSISRRESILKYHDGRNMFGDAWEENFFLQQKSLFFFKEGYHSYFLSRNNFSKLNSLKFVEIKETSVLKKHGFLIFLWKIIFFNLLCFFFSMCIFKYFGINSFPYNLIFIFLILFSIYPYVLYFFFKDSFTKYRLNKIRLRLFLRKPYLNVYNVFFFYNFITYIFKWFFSKFFFFKISINFFVSNFFGYLLLRKLKYLEKNHFSFLNFFKNLLYIMLLFIFIILIYLFFFFNILIFYNFFSVIISYYLFLKILIIFKNFILLCFFFKFLNFFILNFNRVNHHFLNLLVKLFFNNDYIKFVNFLNKFFYKHDSILYNNNEIKEQLKILKNLKTQQFVKTYSNLKTHAI